MTTLLVEIQIRSEADVVHVRGVARSIAETLGFSPHARTGIATATSEIVRNAWQHGGGGSVRFELVDSVHPPMLRIVVADRGPGIVDLGAIEHGEYISRSGLGLGIVGARRLMDRFEIDSAPGGGTSVVMERRLPLRAPTFEQGRLRSLAEDAARLELDRTSYQEVEAQNHELIRMLDELRAKQEELNRLNRELEDTNRGVVALYAELDERADSLRRADELKSRFLSHMSHEFRTPLNSIIALSRLLLDRMDGELTSEQEKQVEFIRRAAEELTDLVNDLLDLAKVEAGKIEVHTSQFTVADLFGTLRGMLRPLLVNDAVSLHISHGEGLKPLVTDEGKVAQIVRNFISNALKFTERGEVRVTASAAPGDRVIIAVSDTGIGIAPQDQELIFQEFAQLESGLQKRVRGTGLGLPLSRKLAELLGGEIRLESRLGVGSTFSLLLPRRYGTVVLPRADSDIEGARRVLVVDDEEIARYLYRQVLAGAPYVLLEAPDGARGLEIALAERPDLIVLDLVMPEMTGIEVLRRLRADDRTASIPVILSTSKRMGEEEMREIASGSAEILPKDLVTRERVLATFERILSPAGGTAAAEGI